MDQQKLGTGNVLISDTLDAKVDQLHRIVRAFKFPPLGSIPEDLRGPLGDLFISALDVASNYHQLKNKTE